MPRFGFYGPNRKSQAEDAEFVTVLVTLSASWLALEIKLAD